MVDSLPSPRGLPSPKAPPSPKSPKAFPSPVSTADEAEKSSKPQPQWDPLTVLGIKSSSDTIPEYRCVSFTPSSPSRSHPPPPPSVCSTDSSRTVVPSSSAKPSESSTSSSMNSKSGSSRRLSTSSSTTTNSSSPPSPPTPSFRCGWTIHSARTLTRIRAVTHLMSVQMPDQIDHAQLLRLARACLCTELHKHSGDEADVIYRWTNALEREASRLRELGVEIPPLSEDMRTSVLEDTDEEADENERRERRRRERRARRESEVAESRDKVKSMISNVIANGTATVPRMHKGYHLRLVRSGTTPQQLKPSSSRSKPQASSAPSSPVTQPPAVPPTPGPYTSIPQIFHSHSSSTSTGFPLSPITSSAAAATATTHHLHLPPSPSHSHPQASPTFQTCGSAMAAAASECARMLEDSRAEGARMLDATAALVARVEKLQLGAEHLQHEMERLHLDMEKGKEDDQKREDEKIRTRYGGDRASFCAGVLAGAALPYLLSWDQHLLRPWDGSLAQHSEPENTTNAVLLLGKVACLIFVAALLGSSLWAEARDGRLTSHARRSVQLLED